MNAWTRKDAGRKVLERTWSESQGRTTRHRIDISKAAKRGWQLARGHGALVKGVAGGKNSLPRSRAARRRELDASVAFGNDTCVVDLEDA